MKQILLWLFFGSFIVISSCSKKDNVNAVNNPFAAAKTMTDVAYGSNIYQKMDVYLPPNRSTASTKVFVIIHGGAWSAGDKSAENTFIDTLKRRFPDYAIFNLNYRLSNGITNLFPAQENDIQSASQYIYNKRSEYGISDKWVYAGESAGGHLSMLQAYKYNMPVKAKAVVSFFGPSDMLDMYNNPVNGNTVLQTSLASVIGGTPSQNAAIYTSSSPINYISATTGVPTISFHGSADLLVNPSQSEIVKILLAGFNIPASYTLYPGKGHGTDWSTVTFSDAFEKIQVFLNTYVQ